MFSKAKTTLTTKSPEWVYHKNKPMKQCTLAEWASSTPNYYIIHARIDVYWNRTSTYFTSTDGSFDRTTTHLKVDVHVYVQQSVTGSLQYTNILSHSLTHTYTRWQGDDSEPHKIDLFDDGMSKRKIFAPLSIFQQLSEMLQDATVQAIDIELM